MEVSGIKLRNTFQTYYVETNNLFVKRNTLCLAETEHGVDIGHITKLSRSVRNGGIDVKGKLLRMTSDEDLKVLPEVIAIEKRAFRICRDKGKEKNLGMKLIAVKCLFDKTKILFYFVADNRIDFRELVRELAAIFRTRIEMRQIGVRDEARLIGGFGPCGRHLCCMYLREEFEPVSIKMAKEQNLNLNSLKISGMCGRLQCCIGHEYELYKELNRELPPVGTRVTVGNKAYRIETVEFFKRLVRIRCEDHLVDVSFRDLVKKGDGFCIAPSIAEKILAYYIPEAEEKGDRG